MNISRSSLDKVVRIYNQIKPKVKEREERKNNEHYTDKVSFSKDAKYISKALRLAKNSEGIRYDKVEKIKSQIRNGTYNVDGELVAQKIIEDSIFDKLQ